VTPRNDRIVIDAIRAELDRGGQVFYVVPRVDMIEQELSFLHQWLPDVRTSSAHGQLKDLEQRIVEFTLGEVDVLVATTILENGIDMPNVNTIILQQSQFFGISQLHQLRGRVGRANLQAYAYLFHAPLMQCSAEAAQRLAVLQRETELGSGFALAESDMRMRGSGNLFGTQQKGTSDGPTQDIGADLFNKVLQKAMRYLEKKKALALPDDPEMEAKLLQESVDENMLMGLDDALDVK
jgi:transcription-repair coupling factor (superfamily II helicase)